MERITSLIHAYSPPRFLTSGKDSDYYPTTATFPRWQFLIAMQMKLNPAVAFTVAAAVLFSAWLLCRYNWTCCVRLNLAFYGCPFVELRDDPPGARPPQADLYGIAYRSSVYSDGKYIGLVERMGYFCPVDDHGGDAEPDSRWWRALQGTVFFLQYAQWLAACFAGIAGFLFFRHARFRKQQRISESV